MVQLEFNFFDSEAPEMKAASESARLQNLRFEAIARMVADRNEPVYAIARKIAAEMAASYQRNDDTGWMFSAALAAGSL